MHKMHMLDGSGVWGTTIILLLSLFFRISLVGYTETKRNLWATIVPIVSVSHQWPPVYPHACINFQFCRLE